MFNFAGVAQEAAKPSKSSITISIDGEPAEPNNPVTQTTTKTPSPATTTTCTVPTHVAQTVARDSPSSVADAFDKDGQFKPSFKPNERINPFDKNGKSLTSTPPSASTTPASSYRSESSSTSGSPRYSGTDAKVSTVLDSSGIKSTALTNSVVTGPSEKSLDDLIKDRFQKQQGLRDQTTGRYVPPQETVEPKPTVAPSTEFSSYKYTPPATSIPSTGAIPSTASVYAAGTIPKSTIPDYKSEVTDSTSTPSVSTQSSFSRTNSQSDVDIIFGGKKDADIFKSYTSNAGRYGRNSDADVIFGGTSKSGKFGSSESMGSSVESRDSSIYAKRDDKPVFAKSMSVAADNRRSQPPAKPAPTYKIYEGIQNQAFTDYESPSKSGTSSTTKSYWNPGTDDEYDLK